MSSITTAPGLLSIHTQAPKTITGNDEFIMVSEALYEVIPAGPITTPAKYVKRPLINYGFIDQYVHVSQKIPRQVLKLIGYRVELKDLGVGNASGNQRFTGDIDTIHVELPFLTDSQLIDNHKSTTMIPLPLNEGRITNVTGISVPIYLSKDIPTVFKIRVFEDDPNIVGEVVESTTVIKLSLFFEFDFTVSI